MNHPPMPRKNVERSDPVGPSARPQRRARESDGESSSPRLPHEHDESSDSQSSAPRDLLKQAHDDIEQGQQDTDRRGAHGFEKPENRILQRRAERRLAQGEARVPARERKR